tara:strand:- start:8 stop:202 length:195 start_codon:yes stop_codon:yes gene_type:complete
MILLVEIHVLNLLVMKNALGEELNLVAKEIMIMELIIQKLHVLQDPSVSKFLVAYLRTQTLTLK